MADYPVNPNVLKWAREVRNLTRDDAALRLNISPEELAELEDGRHIPNLTTLRRMAKAYSFPLATFGQSEPLPPRPPITDFRTVDGRPAEMDINLYLAHDTARFRQETAGELLAENPEIDFPRDLPALNRRDGSTELARAERERLGLTNERQQNFLSAAALLRYLRMKVEDMGIFVTMDKVPKECRGFCLLDNEAPPIIVINKEETKAAAQVFTLIHEYCHVLLGEPGISGERSDNPTERFCNQFAANFLMPRDIMLEAFGQPQPTEWEWPDIARAAERLNLSQQSLVLRFEELGYAPQGFYGRWMRLVGNLPEPPPRRRADDDSGPSYYLLTVRDLGQGFLNLVLGAETAGSVSQLDAYRMLHIKPENFDNVRQEINDLRQLAIETIGG